MPCKKTANLLPVLLVFCLILVLSTFIPLRTYAMDSFSFDNGLQTIFEKRENAGVVAAQVWVRTGSRYEDEKIAGITHFIEHLIFKGTEKLEGNAFATRIESLGGIVNAFTSYDNTVLTSLFPKRPLKKVLICLLNPYCIRLFPQKRSRRKGRSFLRRSKWEKMTRRENSSMNYSPSVIRVIHIPGRLLDMTKQ
jgi:hypothetical protein